jgi:hypothetical protein
MPARRFPPPWSVEEYNACFIVRDHGGHTAVEQRRVQYSKLTANNAVVAVMINYLAAVENILQVLPGTKNVMVVVGTSPIEKFWKEAR